jgi:3-hydroxy-9,10-secoandrosta-1,3,5(10)-triene-9,17-dione monooxygenase reductase component
MSFAKSGTDKFGAIEHTEGLGGAPLMEGCLARFECRSVAHHEGDDHVIIVGEVERYDTNEGAPLTFFGGQLGKLVESE